MATKKQNIETKKVYVSNRPNISMKELKKMFPYMTEEELESDMQNNEWIKLEKFLEQERKTNEQYRVRAERPDVKELHIDIEWKKSYMWGSNPHAYYRCYFADGSYESGHFTCKGCGYDKASTVVADVFNACLSGMLWRKRNSKKKTPYGIRRGNGWYFPNFAGGVGVSCYYSITEFLGGKLANTASGSNYDTYLITFPQKKQKSA